MKNHSDFTVHLHRDGRLYSFPAGGHIPDWADEMITNPYVRGDAVSDPRDATRVRASWSPAPEPPAPEQQVAEQQVADTVPTEGADPLRPPENGIGSGQPVWAEYAKSKGIEVAPDWKREDIIAACAKAGF